MSFSLLCRYLVVCWGIAGLWNVAAGADPLDPEQVKFFETRIRPILISSCYECHSEQAKSMEGKLRLDRKTGWETGGTLGPAIVPGNSAASLLLKAIRYEHEDLQMPPAGRLPPEVVADFEKWIQAGAVDPRGDGEKELTKEERQQQEAQQRWAFQRPLDPPVPVVRHNAWCRSDVDKFIVAKLEAAGLTPEPDADRRALIRRATYDLTGLPPTPEEVAAFLADETPDAFAKVIERLLDSPQYGERWGRHWLDVVRYADTAGDNSDFPIPQMYRYRNWVIDAFNRDLPYDEFVKQQLAGDLLPASNEDQRQQQLIATGYLANSRRFGSRVDDYPQHLTIEDTIDNLGRALLGLSLNCARCHDHKFDPVSTEDYYGLYGFFASTRYPWPGIELEQRQRDLVPLIPAEEASRIHAERKQRQDVADAEVRRLESDLKGANPDQKEPLKKQVAAAKDAAKRLRQEPLPFEQAYAVAEGKTRANVKVQYQGDPTKLGPEIARRLPVALGTHVLPGDEAGSGRRQLAEWIASAENPLTARVMVNRVWQYHFGRGLNPTANDFGRQGKPCTHPELLDWLAHRFMEDGWSLKRLHRRLMLSHTYQTASVANPAAIPGDAANDLLSGFRQRRLSAEEIRDTLLVLGGNLDPAPGGPHPFAPPQEWKFTQHNPFKAVYDTDKRSVYLMTQRIQRHPFLANFDGADPSASTPVRTSSITPLQSLYFLNNPLVHAQAQRLAQRLLHERATDAERLARVYELCFARLPADEELAAGLAYLQSAQNPIQDGEQIEVWSSYVRVLFRLSEFVSLD